MIEWKSLYANRSHISHGNLVSSSTDPCIQMAAGYPDPSLFPMQEMSEVISQFGHQHERSRLQYNAPEGYEPLRAEIASQLGQEELSSNNILLTHGSQQGLDLLAKLFINPGDTVIVEAPSFHGALWVLEAAGAHVISIPMDENGLDTHSLESYLRSQPEHALPKFIYTIPTFHNPSGCTMTLERRLELLRVSHHYGVPIIEDAPYNELWYDSEPPPSLLELGGVQQVIYLGTFSKTLCPAFRVGWIVGPESLISKCIHFKHIADTCSNGFMQQVTYQLCKSGFLQDNIQRARQLYRSKRDALAKCIEQIDSDEVKCLIPHGGFFAWLELGSSLCGETLQQQAQHQGVSIVSSPQFYLNRNDVPSACRVTFSYPTTSEIQEGFNTIAQIIQTMKSGV